MGMGVLRAPLATHDGVDCHIILNAFVNAVTTMSICSTLSCIIHHYCRRENDLIMSSCTASACGPVLAAIVDAPRSYI